MERDFCIGGTEFFRKRRAVEVSIVHHGGQEGGNFYAGYSQKYF